MHLQELRLTAVSFLVISHVSGSLLVLMQCELKNAIGNACGSDLTSLGAVIAALLHRPATNFIQQEYKTFGLPTFQRCVELYLRSIRSFPSSSCSHQHPCSLQCCPTSTSARTWLTWSAASCTTLLHQNSSLPESDAAAPSTG